MKGRLGKSGTIFLAVALCLALTGAGFAAWTDNLTIEGTVTTGEVEWEIVTGTQSQKLDDPDWNCFWDLETGIRAVDPDGKNVATTTVVIEAATHPHLMTVTVDNAYPYYYDHIAFQVHGLGNIPLRIWKANFWSNGVLVQTIYTDDQYIYLDLDGDGQNDLELWWGNGFGKQLHECNTHDISFDLLVLQPAPQNQTGTLTFTIELVGIQWNEYVAP